MTFKTSSKTQIKKWGDHSRSSLPPLSPHRA